MESKKYRIGIAGILDAWGSLDGMVIEREVE